MTQIKNRNNERAKFAYDKLKKIPTEQQAKFRSLARSFPTMVQVNGLTAAVAFLFAKGTGEHKKLYDIISEEVGISVDEKSKLMDAILKMEGDELRLKTSEVMALLVWIKRFAEGMFEADEQPKKQ